MNHKQSAFSLVEVTLALGVIAFALIAILGLLPVGLKSSGESGDTTRMIMFEASTESIVRASVTATDFTSTTPRTIGPVYYSKDGTQLAAAAGGFYRVDATIGKTWANPLANVNESYLRPVSAVVRWPIDTTTGNPRANNSSTSFTFYVRKP